MSQSKSEIIIKPNLFKCAICKENVVKDNEHVKKILSIYEESKKIKSVSYDKKSHHDFKLMYLVKNVLFKEKQCKQCGWIKDVEQEKNKNLKNKNNELSYNQYKENYKSKLKENPYYKFEEITLFRVEHHKCPVCNKYTFDHYLIEDICDYCGWRNAYLMQKEPNDWAGCVNNLCFNDYKKLYQELIKKKPKYKWLDSYEEWEKIEEEKLKEINQNKITKKGIIEGFVFGKKETRKSHNGCPVCMRSPENEIKVLYDWIEDFNFRAVKERRPLNPIEYVKNHHYMTIYCLSRLFKNKRVSFCIYCGWERDNKRTKKAIDAYKWEYIKNIIRNHGNYIYLSHHNVSYEHECPICQKYLFKSLNSYDVCDNCGWRDDIVMLIDDDKWECTGNSLSFEEYKDFYETLTKNYDGFKWSKHKDFIHKTENKIFRNNFCNVVGSYSFTKRLTKPNTIQFTDKNNKSKIFDTKTHEFVLLEKFRKISTYRRAIQRGYKYNGEKITKKS